MLRMRKSERALMIGGVGSFLIALAFQVSGIQNKIAAIGMAIIGVAFWLAAGVLWIRDRIHPEVTESINLYFDAEVTRLPTNSKGVIGAYELSVGTPDGIGSTGMLYDDERNHDLVWPTSSGRQTQAIQCQIINYGPSPIV